MFSTYKSSHTQKSGRASANLYLQHKWDAVNYENHKYNLKTAKHNIDNAAPKTFPHLYYRPKRLQVEMERFCTIQRNNKHLMDRLAIINKKGGWVDNKNDYKIKSLNTWKRQQEMIELASRNQTIYQRLLNAQSAYNVNKMEDEYLLQRKYEANISKFPTDWRSTIEHLNLTKRDIRKKITSMRTGKCFLDQGKKKIAREKSAREAKETQIKTAEEAKVKAGEVKDGQQCKQKKQEHKRQKEDWKLESKRWREAREERIRLAKECLEEDKELEKEAKIQEEDKQKRRHLKKKMEVEEWKQKKKEEEEAEEEKCKALVEKVKQRRMHDTSKVIGSGKARPTSSLGNVRSKKEDIGEGFAPEKKGAVKELDLSDASDENIATGRLVKENEGDKHLASDGKFTGSEKTEESSSVDDRGKESEKQKKKKT